MAGTHAKTNKLEKVEVKDNSLENAIAKLLSRGYTIKTIYGEYELYHSKFNQHSIVDRHICVKNANSMLSYARDLYDHDKSTPDGNESN